MNLKELAKEIIEEISSIENGERPTIIAGEFPVFFTSTDNRIVYFTKNAQNKIYHFSEIFHQNRSKDLPRVDLKDFIRFNYQSFANTYSANINSLTKENFISEFLYGIKKETERIISENLKTYTHHFPAWTVGFESISPLSLNEICIQSRESWIEKYDFPDYFKNQAFNQSEANSVWKITLKRALNQQSVNFDENSLAKYIYDAISACPAMVSIMVKNLEKNLSRKLAHFAAKTALDSTSLLLGRDIDFHKQVLHEDRSQPFATFPITGLDDFIGLPGSSLSKRTHPNDPEQSSKILTDNSMYLNSVSKIIDGLINSKYHPHSSLCSRWATALHWYAEGQREIDDAIALSKIATSLDVLSNGGKNIGIRKMVSNLLGCEADTIIVKGTHSITLSGLVSMIYDDGRSQILHGTHHDKLISFETERNLASQLSRHVLIVAAINLNQYTGNDSPNAFMTMPSSATT